MPSEKRSLGLLELRCDRSFRSGGGFGCGLVEPDEIGGLVFVSRCELAAAIGPVELSVAREANAQASALTHVVVDIDPKLERGLFAVQLEKELAARKRIEHRVAGIGDVCFDVTTKSG